MTPLPWSVRIYIAGMVLLVTCLAIPALLRADPLAPSDLILAVVLGGLMMIAWLEPFPLSFKRKLYLDTSVVVAAILLLQPGVAMIAVGAGTLLAQVIRRQGLAQSAFNAAQTKQVPERDMYCFTCVDVRCRTRHPDALARRPIDVKRTAGQSHFDWTGSQLSADGGDGGCTGAGATGAGQAGATFPDAQLDRSVLDRCNVDVDPLRKQRIALDLRPERLKIDGIGVLLDKENDVGIANVDRDAILERSPGDRHGFGIDRICERNFFPTQSEDCPCRLPPRHRGPSR